MRAVHRSGCRAGRSARSALQQHQQHAARLGTRTLSYSAILRAEDGDGLPSEPPHANAAAPSPVASGPLRLTARPPARAPVKQKTIFSGIQPTGVPHLGNYLGALREWKRLQDSEPCQTQLLFCVADLHALTSPQALLDFGESRMHTLAALLAVGLDPQRCTLFFQSSVASHTYLYWLLSCTASTGYLSRMTQWKSKLQLREDATLDDDAAAKTLRHGLFSYPILQAADILVHRATHVPVGEDQRQHLEFTRQCARSFNHAHFSNLLVEPETLVAPTKRIMSLTNPLQKMSKSDPSPKSRILISDSTVEIEQKIGSALTDSRGTVTYEPDARPGVANLLEILSACDAQGRSPARLAEEMKGCRMGELKQQVARAVDAELAPVRDRFIPLRGNTKQLNSVSFDGSAKANHSADTTLAKVKARLGLSFPPIHGHPARRGH